MSAPLSAEDFDSLWRRYLAAQLAGNRREAIRLVIEEGLERGASVIELQTSVIRQAQDEIGRLWQANKISIAQEHMASAISMVVLSKLFESAPPAVPLGKRLLVACVEGEQHELPARLISDVLELEGFEVRYLGANVPTDDLITSIRAQRPDGVALSVTMTFNVPSLKTAVERIRQEIAGDLPIMVGGHALQWAPRLVQDFGVHGFGNDPVAVANAARGLFAEGTP